MLRLAVLTARGRTGAFAGALIALFAAAVLSMAWGMQLESILRTHPNTTTYLDIESASLLAEAPARLA